MEQIDIRGRTLRVPLESSSMPDAIWITFRNVLPTCTDHVDQDMNRVLFVARGFETDPDVPVKTLRFEMVLSAFPDRVLPAKGGKAEDMVILLTEFLEGIARDFEPRLRRKRRPPSSALKRPPARLTPSVWRSCIGPSRS